jgi:mannose-6-phosphate isomerase
MKPIKLEPIYKSTAWAGRKINSIRHLEGESIGIAREVCAYKGSENIVKTAPYAGQKISEVIRTHKTEFLGNIQTDQLIRIAYMDAREDLSIQVHPNAQLGIKENDFEKSEAWYVLEADEGSRVTVGLSINGINEIRERIQTGKLEPVLIHEQVQTGDFILVPAGLIHACGKGLFVLEIGTYGGITYRLFDYDRGRALDIEKGLEALDPSLRCTITHCSPKPGCSQIGVDHTLFRAEVIDVLQSYTFANEEVYFVLTCVENHCIVRTVDGIYPLEFTESILLPANSGECIVEGTARLIRSSMK